MTKQKRIFLERHKFPIQWIEFGFYTDELFNSQNKTALSDGNTDPSEHIRYGAFLWWLKSFSSISEENLKKLAQLAAFDPDSVMAGAVTHDILFHPSATSEISHFLADLAQNHPNWKIWINGRNPYDFFEQILTNGQQFWHDRISTHKIVRDFELHELSPDDLRNLFFLQSPLILRALVEHPNTPLDLIYEMREIKTIPYSREIRMIANQRIKNNKIPYSKFKEKHILDPWNWDKNPHNHV